MARNLITVFARGNQELFHSAFIAWLLDERAPHSLGSAVLQEVLSLLGIPMPNAGYTIKTESCDRNCRFDLLIQSDGVPQLKKGLVFENKTKSLGQHLQLDRYRDQGYEVAALALLPQTLDESSRVRYPVIEYRQIRDIVSGVLARCRADSSPYQFIVEEYIRYLSKILGVFDALGAYCRGEACHDRLITSLSESAADVVATDNDVRTLNYFYYCELEKYLTGHHPELVFGAGSYKEHEETGQNTRWIYEKNMQGPPYIESLVRDFSSGAAPFRLHSALAGIHAEKSFTLAPRIEVWLDPARLLAGDGEATVVGSLLLGSWDERVKRLFREQEPYRTALSRKGPRNDHGEAVSLGDIRFSVMAARLKQLMERIGYFV